MAVGTVKWFNDAKGFGFIEPEGGGPDVFAHFSAVQMEGFRTLRQGGRVNFDLVQGPKGNLAQNIRPIDSAQPVNAGVAHSHTSAWSNPASAAGPRTSSYASGVTDWVTRRSVLAAQARRDGFATSSCRLACACRSGLAGNFGSRRPPGRLSGSGCHRASSAKCSHAWMRDGSKPWLVVAWMLAASAQAQAPLYTVVGGNKVDPETMLGFRTWHEAGCERCHGPNQEGLFGPSLVESMRVLTKEQFLKTVTNGRLDHGMPSWKSSPLVMDNINQLYACLKGRADGMITKSQVEPMDAP